jgi:arginyl-tRNA synthetase
MEGPLPVSQAATYPFEPAEIQLIDLLSRLPDEVQRAADELKPLHISNAAYELARAFSDFYSHCPVLNAEEGIKANRLRLVAAAKQALANLLGILGIPAPDVM